MDSSQKVGINLGQINFIARNFFFSGLRFNYACMRSSFRHRRSAVSVALIVPAGSNTNLAADRHDGPSQITQNPLTGSGCDAAMQEEDDNIVHLGGSWIQASKSEYWLE